MTVKELIEKLLEMPQDMEVIMDGDGILVSPNIADVKISEDAEGKYVFLKSVNHV